MKNRKSNLERRIDDYDFLEGNNPKKHSRNRELEKEFRTVLAYYKETVWRYVKDVALQGAQYDVARLAYGRLFQAHSKWRDASAFDKWTEADLESQFQPRSLEQDEKLSAYQLAIVASSRLGTRKTKSHLNAVEEAHQLVITAESYLRTLPRKRGTLIRMLEAWRLNSVTFPEILESSGKENSFPLLPTVQKNRNTGKLTPKALGQAVKRYGENSPTSKAIQQKIRQALKDKVISCNLLEEIRWHRFRQHFKG